MTTPIRRPRRVEPSGSASAEQRGNGHDQPREPRDEPGEVEEQQRGEQRHRHDGEADQGHHLERGEPLDRRREAAGRIAGAGSGLSYAGTMSLDLTASPVETVSRRSAWGRVLLTLGLVVTAVLALIGAGALAWSHLVYTPSDRGSCLIIDSSQCRSLSVQSIEEAGFVTLPEGTTIVKSGAGSVFLRSGAWTLVELPEHGEIMLDGRYRLSSVGEGTPVPWNLEEFSAVDEIHEFNDDAARRSVTIGTGPDGERLAHIEVQR